MAGSAAEWRVSLSQRMKMSPHPVILRATTVGVCRLGSGFHALCLANLLSIAQEDLPAGSVDGMGGNGGFRPVLLTQKLRSDGKPFIVPQKAVAVSTMPGCSAVPREDSTIQPAGTLPATTPTSPHCSGQKMQASVAISQGKKTGKLLDGGPMTPVAASNGTLNPAATGGTTPRNAGDRSPTGRVLGAGPGSTDGRPGYPFATILRSGMSRLLGFVDISPLPSWHPRSLASSSCTC